MLKTYNYLIYLILIGLIFSCKQNKNTSFESQKIGQNGSMSKGPKIYNIEGIDIILRDGPREDYDKLINEKATHVLGEINYMEIDYTVNVIIEETTGNWSKIKVVEPKWLTNSHVGWIPTKNIILESKKTDQEIEKLDQSSFEILKTEHNPAVENFYILIKFSNFNEDQIFDFVQKFRKEICKRDCNIMVYDTKSILASIDIHPLKGKEYIELADHFIAMSDFSSPNLKSWYPYQDRLYKEYGGKNWKKEEPK